MDKKVKFIKNYEYYSINTKGEVYSYISDKFIILFDNESGYLRAKLYKNKISKKYLVHRLVAEAFKPNPENKPCVNHKDSDRHNNNVSNLGWVTYSENVLHSYRFGHASREGENNQNAKLNTKKVQQIRNSNKTSKELAKLYKVSEGHINKVKRKGCWDY